MVKKKSIKRVTVEVPESLESLNEVSESIRKIGEHQRVFDRIQIRMNNQIERIKVQAVKNSLPHQEAVDQLFEEIFNYAEKNRDELTKEGKTIGLPTGTFRWRFTKPAVSIEDVKEFIRQCKKNRKLKRFVRVTITEEPNKEVILEEPEVAARIKGVTIEQKEKFEVIPAKVKIPISRDTGRLEKILPKK